MGSTRIGIRFWIWICYDGTIVKPKTYQLWLRSGAIITLVLLVISIPLGLGMLIGLLASWYNYTRNVRYSNHVILTARYSKGAVIFYAMTSIVVMVLPFLLSLRFTQWFNPFTVAFGLLWIKPIILIFEYPEDKT